jgi:uncharacterized protein with PQ loop repeat
MGKLDDFIEKRAGLLMTIFLSVQASIFLAYSILFCVNNNDSAIELDIFICCTVGIFLLYMIHFAYHSVKYINLDH